MRQQAATPETSFSPSPWLRRGGHAAMFGLLLLALFLYQERTLLLDIAYQTFLMMAEGKPQIMVHRFGVVLVQTLPLTAIRLHLPLQVVLILYSASFPLLFWLFYWLIANVLKNQYLGWALVGLYTWIVYDGFYWAPSEQQQAMGLVLVVFAFALRYPALQKPWMWGVMALSVLALAYYHPLIFIPFFFLWAYGALTFRELRHRRFLIVALWMLIVLALKSVISSNWYDDNKYDTFLSNLITYFPRYWALPSNHKFLIHVIQYWYFLPLLLLGLSIFYVWHRHWWRLMLVWTFIMGHLFLLHVASPNATYRFYAEVNYLPLMIYVGVPLMLELAPRVHSWKLLLGLLLGITLFRLAVIARHHQPFTERINWLQARLESWEAQEPGGKFYMPADKAPIDILLMTWGSPYETLLMSALKKPEQAATLVILPDPAAHQQALEQSGFFVTEFKDWPLENLQSPYFKIKSTPYKLVE